MSARKEGKRTTEFKALVGGSMAVIMTFIVGKVWPGAGMEVDEQELVLALTGMVSAYMAVRGWVKSASIKADGAERDDD